jgi:hypothetical protein
MDHEPFRDYRYPEMMSNWPYFYPKWQNLCGAFYHYKKLRRVEARVRFPSPYLRNASNVVGLKERKRFRERKELGKGPGYLGLGLTEHVDWPTIRALVEQERENCSWSLLLSFEVSRLHPNSQIYCTHKTQPQNRPPLRDNLLPLKTPPGISNQMSHAIDPMKRKRKRHRKFDRQLRSHKQRPKRRNQFSSTEMPAEQWGHEMCGSKKYRLPDRIDPGIRLKGDLKWFICMP